MYGLKDPENIEFARKVLDKQLSRIDDRDLKAYFLMFPAMFRARVIVNRFLRDGTISSDQRKDLTDILWQLFESGLGEKYIPCEVDKILDSQV